MQKKYYLDTNIWRDYFENREDNLRPLGEWAFELLRKAKINHTLILYSQAVVSELKICYSLEQIKDIFKIISSERLLIEVKIGQKQVKEARNISKRRKLPFTDVLHAILARDNRAVIVTRDKHFQILTDITIPKTPEELI